MFTATLPAKSFKKIIRCISTVITEADFKVTREGIKFTTMDPSHISMIDFHMAKEHFEEYFLDGELDGETSLGMDIEEIRELLKYEVTEKCKARFGVSYLKDLCKFFSDSVEIRIGTDMPIQIDFILENADFTFIQAPKVEREA